MNKYGFLVHALLSSAVCLCVAGCLAAQEVSSGAPAHLVVTVEAHHGIEVPVDQPRRCHGDGGEGT